jgi:hypothetical protein
MAPFIDTLIGVPEFDYERKYGKYGTGNYIIKTKSPV